MIDSKTVQEVQKELIAAVQRGQEQVRKGQERMRKGQEQVRKSREVVAGVVSDLAKSVLPDTPAGRTVHIPTPAEARAHAREIATHAMSVQRELAGKAWQAAEPYAERVKTTQRDLTEKARHSVPYAERIIAAPRELADRARRAGVAEQLASAQRTLSERVTEAAKVASPLVAEGRARLSQAVGARLAAGKPGAADGAGQPELAEVRQLVVNAKAAEPATAEPKPGPTAAKTTATKTGGAKTRTAKTGTANTGTAETGTAKTGAAKTGAARTGAARASGTSKPRAPKK